MTFVYPADDLDDPQKILALQGSWWSNVYDGRGLLLDRMQAKTDREKQAQIEADELFDSISRLTVPVFHTENYYAIRLLASEKNNNDAAMLRYDGEPQGDYDGSPQHYYDVPLQNDCVFALGDIVDTYAISNRITEPSVVLHKNIDFQIDREIGALVFRDDPFANPLIPQTQIYQDGIVVDQEIILWAFRAKFDREHIHQHFGYVLSYKQDSSEPYRDAVNAALGAIVGGTALSDVERLAERMAGIELVRETGEVVADIAQDALHLLVITDKHVYRFPRTSTASVAVGDVLQAGQPLTTAYELWEFRRGEVSENVAALALSKGILGTGYFGELLFENTAVPLVVSGATGQERVEFEVKGHPLDVEKFWDTVHTNRLVYGQSLYELLRAQGPLPATINPMEFVVSNLLRNNAFAIRLSVAGFGHNALGLSPGMLFRRIIPPHSTLILIVELPPLNDSGTMALDDTGMASTVSTETGNTPATPQNLDDTGFTAKVVNFTCQ